MPKSSSKVLIADCRLRGRGARGITNPFPGSTAQPRKSCESIRRLVWVPISRWDGPNRGPWAGSDGGKAFSKKNALLASPFACVGVTPNWTNWGPSFAVPRFTRAHVHSAAGTTSRVPLYCLMEPVQPRSGALGDAVGVGGGAFRTCIIQIATTRGNDTTLSPVLFASVIDHHHT